MNKFLYLLQLRLIMKKSIKDSEKDVRGYYLLIRKIIKLDVLPERDVTHLATMFADVAIDSLPKKSTLPDEYFDRLLDLINNSDSAFIRKEKERLEKESQKQIKKQLCKKCGGVKVHSWITAMMAGSHGKRCWCKK